VDALGKTRLACVFALTLFAVTAAAQTAPSRDAKAPSESESATAAKTSFLALSEADRKATQDALGWLGFYNGVVDGAYGKRTIEALIVWQQSLPATGDGIVTPKQLASLKSAAAKAKADVGFKVIDDSATGVRFGAPLKLLETHESTAGATSLRSEDGEIGLYLKQTSGELASLYKTMIALPNRKVTYKYLKPDAFFVIAGEEGDKKFYRRYAAPANPADPKVLRGFAFLYPKARSKALDPVALAVANAFEPFPVAAPASPAPSPTPEPAKLTAVAFIVKPGEAVTTLPPTQCKTPIVEGKPVRFLEGGEGLFHLAGVFGERATAPAVADAGDDLVALSLAAVGDTKSALQVASAVPAPGGERKILAALGPVAIGAPLFDRHGRLVAFVAPGEPAKRRADVALVAPYAIVAASALGASATPAPSDTPLSLSEIAAKMRDAVVGVFCGP